MQHHTGGREVGDANPQVRSAGTSERASYICIGSNFWVSIAAFPEDQAEHRRLSLLALSGQRGSIFTVP